MSGCITDEMIRAGFSQAGDFVARVLDCGGNRVFAYMIDGLVSGSDASHYVFQPMAQMERQSMEDLYRKACRGGIYNSVADPCPDLKTVQTKLVNGFCVVLFPGVGAVAFEVKTPEKRGISPPDVENTVKGPKDAFTETVRTNTSILRRHLRTPDLRLYQTTVGQRSLTMVTVAWIDGLTNPKLVERMKTRLAQIDVDGLLSPAAVEEYVTGSRKTPFPLLQYTQRGDKFAEGLLTGRIGLLVDGLPLGYLLPVDIGYLMTSQEDEGVDYLSASFIRILRYGALLLSLLLPGIYVAMATFHQQMIPLALLRSMIESKQSVPFSTVTEVAGLLLAFELLQQAGIHLPKSIGQSVSIIGGIVVGTAAVEASLISPAALIVVSLAGVCGFALPNQELAEALRLCRLGMTAAAAFAGMFGIAVGWVLLLRHLSGLESMELPYLAPFSQLESVGILRTRLVRNEFRPKYLNPLDRRRQK